MELQEEKNLSEFQKTLHSSIHLLIVITMCLLLTVLLRPVSATTLPSEVLRVSATTLPSEVLRVSQYAFSEKLQNPCAVNTSRLHRRNQTGQSEQERRSTRREVIRTLKSKLNELKENAQTMLNTNVNDCSTLGINPVAIFPSAKDVLNSDPIEVLRLFYTSLLNHTAYVYFLSEPLQRNKSEACDTVNFTMNSNRLGLRMRELMCLIRVCILELRDQYAEDEDDYSYFVNSTAQILDERLVDQPMCSRRYLMDCQTVRSTDELLTEMTSYLNGTSNFTVEDSA